jgi:hypothetical protein
VVTQSKSLEIEMFLDSTLGRGQISTRLVQVKYQIDTLTIQLQDMVKGKVMFENIWCTFFHEKGHHQNECSIGRDLLVGIAICTVCTGLVFVINVKL